MKVPQYEQQVDPRTTQLSQAQAPGLSIPREVFGGDSEVVLNNIEKAGKTAEIASGILQKRAEQQMSIKNADLENQFMVANQNLLHSPDPTATKIVKIGDQDAEVPSGLLDRYGNQVHGASQEYEQSAAGLMSSYLGQVKNPIYRAQLKQALTPHYLSGRESVISHEVTQGRIVGLNTLQAKNTNLVYSVGDNPQQNIVQPDGTSKVKFDVALDQIHQGNIAIGAYTGKNSTEEIQKMDLVDYKQAAVKAGDAMIQQGVPIDDVLGFLQRPGVNEKLAEVMPEVNQTLEYKAKAFDKYQHWQNKLITTKGASDLSQNLIDGTLNSDTIQAYQQAGKIDTNTAAIFDAVARKVDFNIPDSSPKGKPDYFLRLLDKGKKSDVASLKVINDATEAYGRGDLGADQYAYFIQEANKRFQRETKGQTGWDKSTDFFRNSAHALNDFAKTISQNTPDKIASNMIEKLVERVRKGEDPTLAAQAIQKETVIEHHPQALTYPIEGRSILDKDGNIKIILPDGTLKDQEKKKEPSVSKGK
jgi:hypothetical protein